MAHDPTDALRQLLRQADELEQRMLQLQKSFAKVRDDFEAMFAAGVSEPPASAMQPPRPHLHDPGIVDMALNALASSNDDGPQPPESK